MSGSEYWFDDQHTHAAAGVFLLTVDRRLVLQLRDDKPDIHHPGRITAFGGGYATSPMSLVFDFQDLGDASNTPATVLYDGAVPASTATCTFVAVNSIDLTGSMGFCGVTQTGSAWVVSTLPGGTTQTRLIGTVGAGDADVRISSFNGTLHLKKQ